MSTICRVFWLENAGVKDRFGKRAFKRGKQTCNLDKIYLLSFNAEYSRDRSVALGDS